MAAHEDSSPYAARGAAACDGRVARLFCAATRGKATECTDTMFGLPDWNIGEWHRDVVGRAVLPAPAIADGRDDYL